MIIFNIMARQGEMANRLLYHAFCPTISTCSPLLVVVPNI